MHVMPFFLAFTIISRDDSLSAKLPGKGRYNLMKLQVHVFLLKHNVET